MMDTNEDYVTEEMEKQKKKLRDIGSVLDSQHQLLRLIIQVSQTKFRKNNLRWNFQFLSFRKWKLKQRLMMLMKVFRQMTSNRPHHVSHKIHDGIHRWYARNWNTLWVSPRTKVYTWPLLKLRPNRLIKNGFLCKVAKQIPHSRTDAHVTHCRLSYTWELIRQRMK